MSESSPQAPELCVVIPTFEEAAALPGVLRELAAVAAALPAFEVRIADDPGRDDTAAAARAAAEDLGLPLTVDTHMGPRDLASAVLASTARSRAPWIAVIDGDGSHDPADLPRLWAARAADGVDVAVGSRWAPGARVDPKWPQLRRRWTRRVQRTLPRGLASSDPFSGYFVARREALRALGRPLLGFKLLLELLATGARPVDVPIRFRPRAAGRSKLSLRVLVRFFWQWRRIRRQRAAT